MELANDPFKEHLDTIISLNLLVKSKMTSRKSVPKPITRKAVTVKKKTGLKGVISTHNQLSAGKRRKLQVLRRILAAARKVFIRDGYENARPQDIVNEAGIAYGTFYDYFSSKRDCFIAFVNDVDFEVYRVIDWYLPPETSSSLPPEVFMKTLLKAMFGYALIHPGIFKAMIPESGFVPDSDNKTIMRRAEAWVALIRKWQGEGMASDSYNPSVLADMMTVLMGLGIERVTRHPEDEDEIIENITQFIARALNVCR